MDAIARIQVSTNEISFEDFRGIEEIILQGILYNFIIIGEAYVNFDDRIQKELRRSSSVCGSNMNLSNISIVNKIRLIDR